MGFFNNGSNSSRVAVLESKMQSYDKYFGKIEESIEKLSEVSYGIKEMLIKHEGRIEERILTEETLESRISSVKQENQDEYKKLAQELGSIEAKVEDIMKWRWTAAGALLIIGLFIGQVVPNAKSVPGEIIQHLMK